MAKSLSKMSWGDLLKKAGAAGVYEIGMTREEVEAALENSGKGKRQRNTGRRRARSSCSCRSSSRSSRGGSSTQWHPIYNDLARQ